MEGLATGETKKGGEREKVREKRKELSTKNRDDRREKVGEGEKVMERILRKAETSISDISVVGRRRLRKKEVRIERI